MRNFQDTFETYKRSYISAFFNLHGCTFKDTHRGNIPSNKTKALTKVMNIYIWAIDRLN